MQFRHILPRAPQYERRGADWGTLSTPLPALPPSAFDRSSPPSEECPRPRPTSPLQASPEEVPHLRRQVEVGNVAAHVEQFQAEERHDVADDDHDQEDLGRDAQDCARGDLRSEDGGYPGTVEFGHV